MQKNNQDITTIAKNLDDFEKTCAITLTLRIINGSCLMNKNEKKMFLNLYENISDKRTEYFDDTVLALITLALTAPTPEIYKKTKELSSPALDMITRPKMKLFKNKFRKLLARS